MNTNKDTLISVIVPIYKVEKYIHKCIDSILAQTYRNLEVILIDDGSPDNCPMICDQYQQQDIRIIVIHQANTGLSGARNTGISKATGQYITFIDSDDYIHPNYIEQLYITITKSHKKIAACSYSYLPDQLSNNLIEEFICYNSYEAIKEILLERDFQTSAWGKLYSLDLFDSIKFPLGKIFEDYATVPQLLHLAGGIAYVNSKLYYYNNNTESITKSKFNKNQMQYFEIASSVNQFIKKYYPNLLDFAYQRDVSVALAYYKKMSKDKYQNKEHKKKVASIINQNLILYLHSYYPLKKKIAALGIFLFPRISAWLFLKA